MAQRQQSVCRTRARLLVGLTVLAFSPAALSACGSAWQRPEAITAASADATTITVDYGDFCWSSPDPMPQASVVESATEVRITPNVRSNHGNQKACKTDEQITLQQPIGDRKVIDTRSGGRYTVSFG